MSEKKIAVTVNEFIKKKERERDVINRKSGERKRKPHTVLVSDWKKHKLTV